MKKRIVAIALALVCFAVTALAISCRDREIEEYQPDRLGAGDELGEQLFEEWEKDRLEEDKEEDE